MALMLDIEKAFNQMDWSFLLEIFSMLGFHPKMDQLDTPMYCYYCLLHFDGRITLWKVFFLAVVFVKGLDPLSPFLFISSPPRPPTLSSTKLASRLLFADDLMLFPKAKVSKSFAIRAYLDEYSRWSGQKVNFS
jgi:hypothetical protein